jgi:hypothetical protein
MGGLRSQARDRAAAAFVLAVLVLGTLTLCIGIPVGGAWAIGELTDSQTGHYLGVLLGVPFAMAMFTPVLFWLNRLYLRITEASHDGGGEETWDAEGDEPRLIPRGPLEPLLMISFAIALVAFIVWFFFFAENPVLR